MTLIIRAIAFSALLTTAAHALHAACAGSTPGPRTSHAMAFDSKRALTLVFGGSDGVSPTLPTSLWAWNGRRWSCLSDSGPSGRMDAELGYDHARDRLILFGGRVISAAGQRFLSDTWEWDGAGWKQVATTGPGARVHMVMAHDRIAAGILMFGGTSADADFHDTWRWDGSAWQLLTTAAPRGFPNAMTASADGRARLMMAVPDSTAGDGLFQAELFDWNGKVWARQTTGKGNAFSPQAPAARTADGVILYAGWDPGEKVHASRWDGSRWLVVPAMPGRRRGARMSYDERRDTVVLFGGENDSEVLGDIWEWSLREGWTKLAGSR